MLGSPPETVLWRARGRARFVEISGCSESPVGPGTLVSPSLVLVKRRKRQLEVCLPASSLGGSPLRFLRVLSSIRNSARAAPNGERASTPGEWQGAVARAKAYQSTVPAVGLRTRLVRLGSPGDASSCLRFFPAAVRTISKSRVSGTDTVNYKRHGRVRTIICSGASVVVRVPFSRSS